jgi:hypothetical protein
MAHIQVVQLEYIKRGESQTKVGLTPVSVVAIVNPAAKEIVKTIYVGKKEA